MVPWPPKLCLPSTCISSYSFSIHLSHLACRCWNKKDSIWFSHSTVSSTINFNLMNEWICLHVGAGKDFRDSKPVWKYSKNNSGKENLAKLAYSNDLRMKGLLISSTVFFPECYVDRDLGPCKQTQLLKSWHRYLLNAWCQTNSPLSLVSSFR